MMYLGISALLFGADGIIKCAVERYLAKGDKRPLGKHFILRKHHNSGIFFNIFSDNQRFVASVSSFLTVFTAGIFAGTCSRGGQKLLKTGLSLVLGGACSNTYDRMVRGYVVDYLSFQDSAKPAIQNQEESKSLFRGRFDWLKKIAEGCRTKIKSIVFNLSDVVIAIGAVLVVIGGCIGDKKPKK